MLTSSKKSGSDFADLPKCWQWSLLPKHSVQSSTEFCLNVLVSTLCVSGGERILHVEIFLATSFIRTRVFYEAGDEILVIIIMESAILNLRVNILIDSSEGSSLY